MPVALAIYSKDDHSLETVLERARQSHHDLPGVSVIYRMKFSELPGGRNPFGFRDGLHNPRVEGSGLHAHPGYGPQVKAGEFVMGYRDELGHMATSPEPEVLRRLLCGTCGRARRRRVAARTHARGVSPC